MTENKETLIAEWFRKAQHDLETAQLLYKNEGYTEIIAFHIQQALEKYLKGYLIANGCKLRKIHDLEDLLSAAIEFDPTFADFLNVCRKATKYYMDSRYPIGGVEDYTCEEIKQTLDVAIRLVSKIKKISRAG